jgi:hypothetical protein
LPLSRDAVATFAGHDFELAVFKHRRPRSCHHDVPLETRNAAKRGEQRYEEKDSRARHRGDEDNELGQNTRLDTVRFVRIRHWAAPNAFARPDV